jgi:hypothetical protein
MDIIITAPHTFCPRDAVSRLCDTRAAAAAELIEKRLVQTLPAERLPFFAPGAIDKYVSPPARATSRFSITLALSNRLRADIDLNRPPAEYTEWRTALNARIVASQTAGRRVLVFDIHSFPDDPDVWEKGVEHAPLIVSLDFPGIHNDVSLPAGVKLLQASLANDIIVRALLHGADAFLWEFNENPAALSDAQILAFADWLAAYARRWYAPFTELQREQSFVRYFARQSADAAKAIVEE